MDAEAAKLLGAGFAAIGVGMAALGVGNVFGSFLESALRNPAAADGQQGRLFIGFAAAEARIRVAADAAMADLESVAAEAAQEMVARLSGAKVTEAQATKAVKAALANG
jgi:F-type H+-transporting ATPase subunit c